MSGIAAVLESVRANVPLVHCMTNSVVPEVTANVLLAIGASPAMIDLPEEAEIFAGVASSLLINVGNGSAEQHSAMPLAAAAAASHGRPWVLDPVAVGALPVRTALARALLDLSPTAVRGNASEILGLTGESAGGRGVDSTDDALTVLDTARRLAERLSATVAVSGPTDLVVSPGRVTTITGGSDLMPLVIGTGCSLGATVAACLVAIPDGLNAHDAVIAAHALFAAAGSRAAAVASAPGSFRTAWIDQLHLLRPDQVEGLVLLEEA